MLYNSFNGISAWMVFIHLSCIYFIKILSVSALKTCDNLKQYSYNGINALQCPTCIEQDISQVRMLPQNQACLADDPEAEASSSWLMIKKCLSIDFFSVIFNETPKWTAW